MKYSRRRVRPDDPEPFDLAVAVAKVMDLSRDTIRPADVEPVCQILMTQRDYKDADFRDLIELIRKLAGRGTRGRPKTRAVRGSLRGVADIIKQHVRDDLERERQQWPSGRAPRGYRLKRLEHHKQLLIKKGFPNAERVDLEDIDREIKKAR